LAINFTGKAGAPVAFSGQVSDTAQQKGVGDLVIKMTPPENSPEPQLISKTAPDGTFKVNDLQGKEYLLEVYQGPKPLYRGVVDTRRETFKDIKVKAVK